MAQIPYELIREVQIRTRAAAGLPDYDPSDPTLPALPPLSATIAAAAADASPTDRRCRNCKALLLRGPESIVCLYCGIGPHYDAVPDPIRFTSTVGYQWLLRSLHLDGSELVDPTSKINQGKVQSSPKDLTPLSAFLNFKIPWPAENEISSDKNLDEGKRSLVLTGVAPDRFFLKSKSNGVSDTPVEQPSDDKWAEVDTAKDVAALGNQDLFQNVQSSKPSVSSSEHTTSRALSGWEADFQSADSENQLGGHTSSEHVVASSEGSEIKFDDPESFQSSSSLNVDIGAHLDSVFGPGESLNAGKPNDSASVPTAVGDWNSDDIWNNLGSSTPDLSGGFDATFSTKIDPQDDHTLDHSKDLSTSVDFDLFQDFQSQTSYADVTKNKAANEEHTATDEDVFEDWNDFASSTSLQAPPQNAWAGSSDHVSTSENKPADGGLFSFDNKFEGDKNTLDTDIFSFNNKFEDDKKPLEGDLFSFDNKLERDNKPSEGDLFSFDNKFEGDKKSPERDLFSFDSDFGGDFSGYSQPNLFSTSTSSSNAPAEGKAMMSDDPASIWFSDVSSPSLESVQAANNEDAFGQSSKDGVKMLMSQIHDLSFMLETDLSIPSGSDDHKPV
ncbi:uncharacterized protein LOC131012701 [Salvia miltiorrhiza]|uniref:uncharacterized protein LOC131012701 n=1 Tax=Salvia miltiorrhiza TaxID=226208 RepID=UPI0025AC2068|nr:uncharacterized protein LOC131012701 [Salvia miltiorrhiza]